jgi:hypothetical protein
MDETGAPVAPVVAPPRFAYYFERYSGFGSSAGVLAQEEV